MEIAGIAIVPLIVGLVEVGKRLGLGSELAAPLAVALGVAISLGYRAATGLPQGAEWFGAVIVGLALGLSAAGLYSGAKKAMESGE